MAEEEKESKGSKKLQIQLPTDLIEKLDTKATECGVSLNQYITFLLIADVKSSWFGLLLRF